jgi:hypothetical protein
VDYRSDLETLKGSSTLYIRSAAAADALAGTEKPVVPEEHENLSNVYI